MKIIRLKASVEATGQRFNRLGNGKSMIVDSFPRGTKTIPAGEYTVEHETETHYGVTLQEDLTTIYLIAKDLFEEIKAVIPVGKRIIKQIGNLFKAIGRLPSGIVNFFKKD